MSPLATQGSSLWVRLTHAYIHVHTLAFSLLSVKLVLCAIVKPYNLQAKEQAWRAFQSKWSKVCSGPHQDFLIVFCSRRTVGDRRQGTAGVAHHFRYGGEGRDHRQEQQVGTKSDWPRFWSHVVQPCYFRVKRMNLCGLKQRATLSTVSSNLFTNRSFGAGDAESVLIGNFFALCSQQGGGAGRARRDGEGDVRATLQLDRQ